ncbi:MAG: type II toxin-antitoxin system RelE/ParE family toxin [Acidobacteriota bacterium]|jgi:plasmid stabilization system protein ParE
MRITWSRPAVTSLQAIHDYISRDAPGRADRFVQQLIAAPEPLADFPRMGRVVPEGDGRQRELAFDPYRIIYRIEDDEIYIVTVVHGARNLVALWEQPDPEDLPS